MSRDPRVICRKKKVFRYGLGVRMSQITGLRHFSFGQEACHRHTYTLGLKNTSKLLRTKENFKKITNNFFNQTAKIYSNSTKPPKFTQRFQDLISTWFPVPIFFSSPAHSRTNRHMGQLQESCTVSPPHQNGLVNL